MPSIERSELLKIFREDYVSVSIYKNEVNGKTYYDIVPARLIWIYEGKTKKRIWKRGANFNPDDLMKLVRLLLQAAELLNDHNAIKDLSPKALELINLVA